MRTQGEWPAKWKGQGDFIMPGTDSRYSWQGMIPNEENPFQYNPERAFVSSANQYPADSTYPYYLGRGYSLYRGIIINRKLSGMTNISPEAYLNRLMETTIELIENRDIENALVSKLRNAAKSLLASNAGRRT